MDFIFCGGKMKKNLSIMICILAISGLFAGAAFSAVTPQKSYQANVQSKRMSKGTVLRLQMMDPTSTVDSSQGDMFQGMLVDDKIDEGVMILPKGTIFRGTVDKVVPSKRVSRGAVLYLSLDHVVTPTGRQVPIQTGLMSNGIVLTTDGGIKAGGNYGYALQKNYETATNILKNCIDWGVDVGDKALWGWSKYITIPVGATAGTTGGVLYYMGDAVVDLFKKGGNVTFHQGSVIDFILTDSVDVPVH